MDDNNQVLNWILTAQIVLIVFVVVLGGIKEKNSVVVYGRSCNQENTSAQDCKSWNLFKTTYYVNKYTNQVMFDDTYGLVNYFGCTVVDVNYWYCDLLKGSSMGTGQNTLAYKNGTFIDRTLSSKNFTTEYFGWFKYWLYKISS